jgi:c-di-GMP-binding flagellar brake protein YcgR
MIFLLQIFSLHTKQNSFLYLFVIFAVISAIIFGLVKLIKNHFEKEKTELSDNPDLPTNSRTLKIVAKILDLTYDELKFTKDFCSEYNVTNLPMKIKDEKFIDELFKKIYEKLNKSSSEETEIKKSILFSIRQKIEKHRNKKNSSLITNSAMISVNQEIQFITEDNNQYPSFIIANTQDCFTVQTPKNIFNDELTFTPLQKITFCFETQNNIAYILQSRVLSSGKEHYTQIAHTKNIQALHRRNQKRIHFTPECIFSAVQIQTSGAENNTKIEYKALEKKHTGTLSDISSEGCCILCNLDIRDGQYINVKTKIDGKNEDEFIGIILKTEPVSSEDSFKLHIKFVKISRKIRNKIFSKVYEYQSF